MLTNKTEKLSWIKVLNEEATWSGADEMLNWLSAQCGVRLKPTPAALASFLNCLSLMRDVVDSFHFKEDVRLDWLDERLGKIRFALGYEDWLPVPWREFLPVLHAQVVDNSDDALLRAVADTLLLQFSQFVDNVLTFGLESGIARCQGIFRLAGNKSISAMKSRSDDSELRWRKEIDLLEEHKLMTASEIQRCPDLFLAGPKARFCSDACRFATFQLAKHFASPGYHAEKQKRYRSRQSDK